MMRYADSARDVLFPKNPAVQSTHAFLWMNKNKRIFSSRATMIWAEHGIYPEYRSRGGMVGHPEKFLDLQSKFSLQFSDLCLGATPAADQLQRYLGKFDVLAHPFLNEHQVLSVVDQHSLPSNYLSRV